MYDRDNVLRLQGVVVAGNPWQEDLLNITKAKEWRFLLKGEKKEDIVQSMD